MKTTKQKMARVMLHTSTYNDEGGHIDNWEELAQAALDVVLEELVSKQLMQAVSVAISENCIAHPSRSDIEAQRRLQQKGEFDKESLAALKAAADRLRG